MEELPPVDHASVDYPAFDKCFYAPHPVRVLVAGGRDWARWRRLTRAAGQDVARKDATDAELLRVELDCTVDGRNVPCPVRSFAHLGAPAARLC